MTDFALVLLALGFACLAAVFTRLAWGRGTSRTLAVDTPPRSTPNRPAEAQLEVGSVTHLQGSEAGWLRVAGAAQLLGTVQAAPTLEHMLRQSRLSKGVWERDLQPAIERYAEFVQLMPASESHHHAHAGGLLSHTLEMLLAALTWRNGCLLPQGATAEDLDTWRDHWTYAVFFAALLHDIGKPLTDLRVKWRGKVRQDEVLWSPIAGSLVDCNAAEYLVGFAPTADRDYAKHADVAVTLLQGIAPRTALKFLGCHPQALQGLVQYLGGQDRESGLAMIVRKADQASTRKALMHGSKARFGTALRRPLIEVLMGSLKDMLQRGGELPLNRDGAVGWVYNGSVWFVAKRLADQVREHVQRVSPEEAIPGEERNDRLFDTWQEYGALETNPGTGQAIWHVQVMGKDGAGYSHALSMLRFPLAKLWDHPDRYPPVMNGEIQVLSKRGEPGKAANAGTAPKAGAAAAKAELGPAVTGDRAKPVAISPEQFDAEPADADREAGPRPKVEPGAGKRAKDEPPPVRAPNFNSAAARQARAVATGDAAPSVGNGAKKTIEAGTPAPAAVPVAAPAPTPVTTRPPVTTDGLDELAHFGVDDGDFLGCNDDALGEARRRQSAERMPVARSVAPIVMPPAAPRLPGQEAPKDPPPVAIAFMQWLQAGLASGEIRYNVSGAPVHFVQDGMALVSPLIFRQYSVAMGHASDAEAPDRVGLDIQREVLRAGWHVPAPDGKNIHGFAVLKKNRTRAGRLSAVVLAEPQRFVMPVPPVNPALSLHDSE